MIITTDRLRLRPMEGKDWDHGIAREAMRALLRHAAGHPALRQLVAVTDPENLRSQRVLTAVGFEDRGLSDRPSPSRRGSTQLRRYEFPLERQSTTAR